MKKVLLAILFPLLAFGQAVLTKPYDDLKSGDIVVTNINSATLMTNNSFTINGTPVGNGSNVLVTSVAYATTAGSATNVTGAQSNLIAVAQTNYVGPMESGLSAGSNYAAQVASGASNGVIAVMSASMATQSVGSAVTVTGTQSNSIVALIAHAVAQTNVNNAIASGMASLTTSVVAANTTVATLTDSVSSLSFTQALLTASAVTNGGVYINGIPLGNGTNLTITGGSGSGIASFSTNSYYATNSGNAATVNGMTSTQILATASNSFAPRSWVLGFSNAPVTYNAGDATLDVSMPDGSVGQMFEELWMPVKNTAGVPLTNGVCVRVDDASGALSGVKLVACTDSWDMVLGTIGLATMDTATPVNADGKITTFGNVNDLDTSAFIEGSNLWLSATPGQLTMAKPIAAGCKQVLVGKCLRSHANQGRISVGVRVIPRPEDIGAVSTNDTRYLATLTNAAAFDPAGTAGVVAAALTVHTNRTDNPHSVTAAQVGADPAGSSAAVQASFSSHAIAQTGINVSVSSGMASLTGSVNSANTTGATHTVQIAALNSHAAGQTGVNASVSSGMGALTSSVQAAQSTANAANTTGATHTAQIAALPSYGAVTSTVLAVGSAQGWSTNVAWTWQGAQIVPAPTNLYTITYQGPSVWSNNQYELLPYSTTNYGVSGTGVVTITMVSNIYLASIAGTWNYNRGSGTVVGIPVNVSSTYASSTTAVLAAWCSTNPVDAAASYYAYFSNLVVYTYDRIGMQPLQYTNDAASIVARVDPLPEGNTDQRRVVNVESMSAAIAAAKPDIAKEAWSYTPTGARQPSATTLTIDKPLIQQGTMAYLQSGDYFAASYQGGDWFNVTTGSVWRLGPGGRVAFEVSSTNRMLFVQAFSVATNWATIDVATNWITGAPYAEFCYDLGNPQWLACPAQIVTSNADYWRIQCPATATQRFYRAVSPGGANAINSYYQHNFLGGVSGISASQVGADPAGTASIVSNAYVQTRTDAATATNAFGITHDPSGFAGETDNNRTYSFNPTSRVLTVIGQSTVYYDGQVLTNFTTCVWPAIGTNAGIWYLSWKHGATLATTTQTVSKTEWLLDDIQCSTIYWGGGTATVSSVPTSLVGEETHGFMPWTVHRRLHLVDGTKWANGLGWTGSAKVFTNASGQWLDEDILHSVSQSSTSIVIRRSASLTSPIISSPTSQYVVTNGAGGADLQWDSAGTLATVTANNYVNYWIYAVPGENVDYMSIVGRSADSSLGTITAEQPYDLTSVNPYAEAKLLYRVTLRNVNPPVVTQVTDYRRDPVTGSSYSPASHSTLVNRDAVDSHPLSAITGYETLLISNAATGTDPSGNVIVGGQITSIAINPTVYITNTVVISNSLDWAITGLPANNVKVRWMAMFLSATNEAAASKRMRFGMFNRSDRLCDGNIYTDTNQLYWSANPTVAEAVGSVTGVVADASGIVPFDRYAVGGGTTWDFLTATQTTATVIWWACTNKYATVTNATKKISHANYLTPIYYDDDSGQSSIWCRAAWTTPYTGTVTTIVRCGK